MKQPPIYETDFSYYNRNAGTICSIKGEKYRFSQINEPDFYGKAVKIHKITHIGNANYAEETFGQITAEMFCCPKGFSPDGCHTYNSVGKLEVIDFVGNVSSAATAIFSIRNVLKKRVKRVIKRTIGRILGK